MGVRCLPREERLPSSGLSSCVESEDAQLIVSKPCSPAAAERGSPGHTLAPPLSALLPKPEHRGLLPGPLPSQHWGVGFLQSPPGHAGSLWMASCSFCQGSGLQEPCASRSGLLTSRPAGGSWRCPAWQLLLITPLHCIHTTMLSCPSHLQTQSSRLFLLDSISFWAQFQIISFGFDLFLGPAIQLDLDQIGYIFVENWSWTAGVFLKIIKNFI